MTSATLTRPSYRWRVVDIVVAAVVAVACAVVFVGWNIGSHVLDDPRPVASRPFGALAAHLPEHPEILAADIPHTMLRA